MIEHAPGQGAQYALSLPVSDSNSSSSQTPLIVGVVVGVGGFLLVVVIAIVVKRRYFPKTSRSQAFHELKETSDSNEGSSVAEKQ